MATVLIKLKIMPVSPDTNLEEIKKQAEEKIKSLGASNIDSIEEQPIAFGLKALIFTIAWPEEKNTDVLEKLNESIENISSSQIIDYRRAFG